VSESPESALLPPVAILGAGSMGGAILRGLRASGRATDVRVTTRSAETADSLATAGIRVAATESDPDANRDAVRGAGVVVLGVKPAGVLDLAESIAADLDPHAVVVSVAAGVGIAALEKRLGSGVAVLRAMPNTPAAIGAGATGLSAGTSVDDNGIALAVALFETVGSVHVLPESGLDALTSISGSGPAYVFLFAEALAAAGRARGLPDELASALAIETVAGAARLLAESDVDPAELRRRVTSPNGTTERAIAQFQEGGLEELVDRATAAAAARSAEISAQYD
jgi:pyrroline-5-carboxylate reductase